MKKNQKSRTCPHCHYHYSILDYYNEFALASKDNKYYCMRCQQPFTVKLDRRTKIVFFTAFLSGISIAYITTLDKSVWQMGALVIILVAAFISITFDEFIKLPDQGK